MRIRTITAGTFLRYNGMDEEIEEIGSFLKEAGERYEEEGTEVQTLRLATQSFGTYQITGDEDSILDQISEMERIATRAGIDYLSVGSAFSPRFIKMIPHIIERTSTTCASAWIGDEREGVNWSHVEEAAKAVKSISDIYPDGSGNFRFASVSNVKPDTPFFPAAYHLDDPTTFSIGLESGDIANRALEIADDISDIENTLLQDYWRECRTIQEIALTLPAEGFGYSGLDVSLCPSLDCDGSMANAISGILGRDFGSRGTLSVCRSLTGVLDEIHVKRCGYCGLMLPVMEDRGLAGCANQGKLSLERLLSYSSVCGTGLDMIPLPGNCSIDDIKWVIGDVGTLSVKLDKPLSARLLPIPGSKEGDSTDIDSPHLVNCKVIPSG